MKNPDDVYAFFAVIAVLLFVIVIMLAIITGHVLAQ